MIRREEPLPEPVRENIREEAELPAKPLRREEPIVTAQPQKRADAPIMPPKTVVPPSKAADEDDETWGAIPSFLRRHKK